MYSTNSKLYRTAKTRKFKNNNDIKNETFKHRRSKKHYTSQFDVLEK